MRREKPDNQLIVICGPTAVGKTAVAMKLAQEIGAEIISADSGQVYRGMDIGTAKPTREERKEIPFHLIDLLNPGEQFSAADFRAKALKAIRDIQSRGRRVIIAGGTGLYLKALDQGLFEGPPRDEAIRGELERQAKERGVMSLHEDLQKADPEAAKTIPPQNRQRLIRALEVYLLTGRPISEFWREHQQIPPTPLFQRGARGDFLKFGLTLPKDELHRRINERVDRMILAGLIEEVRALVKKWGVAPGLKLIGYREIAGHLKGERSLKEAVSLIKQHTRQYAKRQLTWFKKDKEIQWFSEGQEVIQHLTK